jgi:hypothetical protein
MAKGMSRSRAKELGDFIEPGQAGLVVVGESKVKGAVQKAVTRAVKETSEDLGVTPRRSTRRSSRPSTRCNRAQPQPRLLPAGARDR